MSTEPSQSPSPSASPSASPLPPSQTPPGAGLMNLSGQIEEGVEAGCLLLRHDGKLYLLIGGDRNVIRAGNRVVVSGNPAVGLMTTCMQGEPFQVKEARMA